MDDADRVMFKTMDPDTVVDGKPVPALTTLLFRVCGNDERLFQEASRLVALFINEALKDGAP